MTSSYTNTDAYSMWHCLGNEVLLIKSHKKVILVMAFPLRLFCFPSCIGLIKFGGHWDDNFQKIIGDTKNDNWTEKTTIGHATKCRRKKMIKNPGKMWRKFTHWDAGLVMSTLSMRWYSRFFVLLCSKECYYVSSKRKFRIPWGHARREGVPALL